MEEVGASIDCRYDNGELCTECCNWMTFILQIDPKTFKEQIAFYVERGCKITQMAGTVAITVRSRCPHLLDDPYTGCWLNSSTKPALCRKYDCRQDPFLKGGKYFTP